MIKDTNEQPDEKIHRMRPERIPNAGVVVSHECVCQPRSPLDPVLWDLMEVSSCRDGQLLSTVWIPPHSPLWQMRGRASNHTLVFLKSYKH